MALSTKTFAFPDDLTAQFATDIAGLLADGIASNGRASLVVSGGRTPVALFQTLAQTELDWDKIDITLADERWVDVEDDASNEKLVKTHLLQEFAAKANFIGLKTEHANAEDAVQACTDRLSGMAKPFDVLILGMGEDGHTASLFPCSEQVEAGLDLDSGKEFIAVQPTTAPNQRMSLTLPALLNSKRIFLHLTGESKRQVAQQADAGSDETEMPIRAIIHRADVTLMWAP